MVIILFLRSSHSIQIKNIERKTKRVQTQYKCLYSFIISITFPYKKLLKTENIFPCIDLENLAVYLQFIHRVGLHFAGIPVGYDIRNNVAEA